MKIYIYTTLIIVALFILFQIYMILETRKTESQQYRTIVEKNGFEIRFYPSVTMATITSSAKTYKELGSSGFNKLAKYIFGGNETEIQIPMTAPVHMDINDTKSSMSFLMPAKYTLENLPEPNDSSVKIENTTDEYVAAISFGGFVSDKDIKRYTKKLEDALKESGITYYGNFRFLGYNPPFQLVGRKNEIIVSVNWDTK